MDLRLNEPRFVKLPDIMKAKRKPLDVIPLADLGVTSENDLQSHNTHRHPCVRKALWSKTRLNWSQNLKPADWCRGIIMSRTLIIAEHDGASLNPSTAKCANCANAIGHEFDIVVIGSSVGDIANQAAAIDGAGSVFAIDADHLANPLAVNHAAEVVAMADGYSHIFGPSTTYGRDLMPRIAALLGVNQVSDISEVEGPYHFKRPIYAGNAIVDVQAPESVTLVATVRVASWKALGSTGNASVEQRSAASAPSTHTRYVGLESGGGERPGSAGSVTRSFRWSRIG